MSAKKLLKDTILKLPYPALYHTYQGTYGLRHSVESEALRRVFGLRKLDWERLAALKKSDTLFVLGSGASINNISPERWEHICAHDTIGFNFWLAHAHVPTFYSYECIDPTSTPQSRESLERFIQVAKRRAEAYRDVPKLLGDVALSRREHLARLPRVWREENYLLPTVHCWARTTDELRYALRTLKREGLAEQGPPLGRLFKYRASLSMMLSLAIKLGYRDVVLCGVDLNTPDYFYSCAERYPEMQQFRSAPAVPVHTTLRPTHTSLAITDILMVMREELLEPLCIGLHIEHTGSALYPLLPHYRPELS